MLQLIKDAVSIFVYLFMIPFCRNKKAVLVYHSIENMDLNKDPHKINITPSLFEKHMKYLSKRKGNYTLTFDDGFENIYTNAFPISKRYNIKTMLFLTTDYIDSKIELSHFFNNKYFPRPLSWSQIKDMSSFGVEIGSHALTHNNLTYLDEEKVFREASDSRKRIKDMVGCDADAFSYPFGDSRAFNKNIESILKNAAYKKIYTNIMGMDNSKDQPFEIRRIRISRTDNMFRFKMRVAGAYNWVDLLIPILCRKGRP